jgi:rod shape-determining protein MreD
MAILHRHSWTVATALLVPVLGLASPSFLRLAGVPPSWAVLWLLPWALVDGPGSGLLAGFGLGLLLDALHPGQGTQIPALIGLGWWWGRLGRRGPPIQRSFSLGLLAVLGTLLLGITVLVQRYGVIPPGPLPSLAAWHTLVAQSVLTGLLAPMICSLLLLLWRQQGAPSRG